MFVSADKIHNYYEITKEKYNKILHNNITKTYKKAQPSLPKQINMETKKKQQKVLIQITKWT